MRHLTLLLLGSVCALTFACGSNGANGANGTDGTTSTSADATSGGDPGALAMRDPDATPRAAGELGDLETTESDTAVATDPDETESTPNIDATDPVAQREGEQPLTPTEADRRRAFDAANDDIRRCLAGTHVRFTVHLRVESSGIVREALVEGEHLEGTPKAQCIEAALRDATFPAFRDPETTMEHAYRF